MIIEYSLAINQHIVQDAQSLVSLVGLLDFQ